MNEPADTTDPLVADGPRSSAETTRTPLPSEMPRSPSGEPGTGPGQRAIEWPAGQTIEAADPALPGPAPLEMRQVAGLTAGPVMSLQPGSFQFHESETDVGFVVTIERDGTVVIVPGTAVAHVDEIALVEPTPLDDSVLNVGSACFTVRPTRPEPSSEHRLATLDAIRRRPGAIVVPEDLATEAVGATQTRSSRFGALFSRTEEEAEAPLDEGWWAFLETIRDARSKVAERHRWLHPDPEELKSRLDRMDPGLWDRGREHPLFGRVALAYATIPWEPRFDRPEHIPLALHQPIREMSRMPWVPVTANLATGPLGIAGPRPAVLAAARHVILSLASLTAPSDLALSIVTAKGLIDDWSWTSALPDSLFPDGTDAFLIAVADGMTHFEGAGFEHEAVFRNEIGLLALGESPDELPEYCGAALLIGSDGRCSVRNHLGEQVVGTPLGVTAELAMEMAASISEAVGADEPALRRPLPPPPERPSRKRRGRAPKTDTTDIEYDDGAPLAGQEPWVEETQAIEQDTPTERIELTGNDIPVDEDPLPDRVGDSIPD